MPGPAACKASWHAQLQRDIDLTGTYLTDLTDLTGITEADTWLMLLSHDVLYVMLFMLAAVTARTLSHIWQIDSSPFEHKLRVQIEAMAD